MDKPILRFNDNGKFRILHITDFHAGTDYNPKLKIGMEALIEETNPDFVMIGGDQCLEKETKDEVREYLCDIIEPILKRKIPWAAVFGNHDREMGISLEDEEAVYESIPYCMSKRGPQDIHGVGNYRIPVYSAKDDTVKYNIWGMDSHRNYFDYINYFNLDKDTKIILPDHFNEGGDNATPLFSQVNWYYTKSKELEKEYGKKVPGVMFMHTPLPEYLLVFRNPEECNARGSKREKGGTSELNSGLFMACLERGDIKGFIFGHEHLIDIQGEYCGVTMACSGALGYNMSCHDDLRGGRIIDICENGAMETRNVKLIDLLGKDAFRDPTYFEGGCRYHIRKL